MGETFNTEPGDQSPLANRVPYVLDLKGAPISFKAMQETFNESCFGMIQPTNILAEPKTMEVVLKFLLPFVCNPKYTGYAMIGCVQHDRPPGWNGAEIRTIAFSFSGAGFKVDTLVEPGILHFSVYGRPQMDSRIINIGIDDG